MNLKNSTTPRFWQLTGDRGESPTYAHSSTYKFNLKDIPPFTRNMCNYLVGVLIFVTCRLRYQQPGEGTADAPEFLDSSDLARGLFASCEIQQTMFGTPVSPNHFLGEYMGLFGFIANGMEHVAPEAPPLGDVTTDCDRELCFFVPLSALLGEKGHHTAQPACCYDRAQLIIRTAASGTVEGLSLQSPTPSPTIRVVAVVNPETELRLGPGTSFMRYTQTAAANGTIINLDGLGNSSTLEGVEPGAGLLWLAAMGNKFRKYGGAFNHAGLLEYVAASFRDIQMTRELGPWFIDWANAVGSPLIPYIDSDPGSQPLSGGGESVGYLFAQGVRHDEGPLGLNAEFFPMITPHKLLELSKVQVVQGTQAVALKSTSAFSGQHVFCALQAHSWTPAKQEEVLRKLVDSGTAQAVWGTNDLVPKIKVKNKQPIGSLNPSKTRFFPITWEPREKVSSPPTT